MDRIFAYIAVIKKAGYSRLNYIQAITIFSLYSLKQLFVLQLRLNPRYFLGLSEAQLISVVLISLGIWLYTKKPSTYMAKEKVPGKQRKKQIKA